jgi:predicted flavoprotein YhiN
VLDVQGRIGGFNFLWAWVSGRKAGEGAAAGVLRDVGAESQSTG